MARRLTTIEVDAARADSRFRPRPTLDRNFSPTASEDFVATILDHFGIRYQREDRFFPTQYEHRRRRDHHRIVELGFAPDFRLTGLAGWYIEVTERKKLQEKHVKVYNAQSIYGIRILLITRDELGCLAEDPAYLLELLQLPVPIAA